MRLDCRERKQDCWYIAPSPMDFLTASEQIDRLRKVRLLPSCGVQLRDDKCLKVVEINVYADFL
jgi:hypothetical protein